MPSETTRILGRAAVEAFETLGFLLQDPDPPEEPVGEMRGVVVTFEGPTSGALVVRADDEVRAALSMNMMGVDATPELALQLDALGEIANVICGNVVPELEDRSAVFRLGAPAEETTGSAGPGVASPAGAAGPSQARGTVRIGLEGGLAEVELRGGTAG